jgi:hypothetical protein
MSSYYPPGHPTGNSYGETRFWCTNEKCDAFEEPVTVNTVYERDTNAGYLDPEDADMCESCREEMEELA